MAEAVTRKILEQKTDIFPARVFEGNEIGKLPNLSNYQRIISQHRNSRCGFIIYTTYCIINFKFLKWDDKLGKHFNRLCHTIIGMHETINGVKAEKRASWHWASQRLARMVDASKSNTDVRTGYKWAFNYFLVKSCFTFGQRKVAPGTSHIYQVGDVEINFYHLTKLKASKIRVRERRFDSEDEPFYDKVVLERNTAYCIPENTVYVIYCVHNSYFSVHVVKNCNLVPFKYASPFDQKKKPAAVCDRLYSKPPPTPQIEDLLNAEDEPSSTFNFSTTAAKPFFEDDGPCSSSGDNCLMSFPNGEQLREEDFMPPPPPPPPPQETTTFFIMPVDRTVNVVSPQVPIWYQETFKFFQREAPPTINYDSQTCDEQPMDLSSKKDTETLEQRPVLSEMNLEIFEHQPGPSTRPTEAEKNANGVFQSKNDAEIYEQRPGPSTELTEAEKAVNDLIIQSFSLDLEELENAYGGF